MVKAYRMSADGLRSSLRAAFAAMWTIEDHPGIWWYVTGCKRDHVPDDPEALVAETNGAAAVFLPDKVAMKTMMDAMGIS